MAADAELALPPSGTLPLIGRASERAVLAAQLELSRQGHGSCRVIEGPGGIGKTRLVRWAAEEAERLGFHVRWGFCLKESLAPFFALDQIFRRSREEAALSGGGPLPDVRLLWDHDAKSAIGQISGWAQGHPLLWLTRDRPALVRQRAGSLPPSAEVLWLSRVESEESLPPGGLDAVGERMEKHLRNAPGHLVVVEGIDYLVSQNQFGPVLSLLQFLRDVAQDAGSHLVVVLRSASFTPRELSLLRSLDESAEGSHGPISALPAGTQEMGRGARVPAGSSGPGAEEGPTQVMLRYLDSLERDVRHGPQLLVVDDVQWADPQTLRALHFLARNSQRLPVALLLSRRSDEPEGPLGMPEGVWTEVREGMEREGLLQHLTIDALPTEESLALIESFLGRSLSRTGAERSLLERAAGSPYFLLATTRLLVEEGRVKLREGRAYLPAGGAGAAPLPDSMRRAVDRRLALVSPDERSVLLTASVIGRTFEIRPLAAALEKGEIEVRHHLRRLERERRFVEPTEPGGERWSFTHPVTWEATVAEARALGGSTARSLAEWWVVHRPEDIDAIARLYHEAREPSRGLPWLRRALERALAGEAEEQAVRWHAWLQEMLAGAGVPEEERVTEGTQVAQQFFDAFGFPDALRGIIDPLLQLKSPPDLRLRLRVLRTFSLLARDPSNAREALRSVVADATAASAAGTLDAVGSAQVAALEAYAAVFAGELGLCAEHAERGLAMLPRPLQGALASRLLGYLCMGLTAVGRRREVPPWARELERVVIALGIPKEEGRFHYYQGNYAFIEGDIARARREHEAAAAAFRRAGASIGQTSSLTNLAQDCTEEGDFPAATAAYRAARLIGERFDLALELSDTLHREGDALGHEGKLLEAREVLGRAREAYDRLENRDALPELVTATVDVLLKLGDDAEADRQLLQLESSGLVNETLLPQVRRLEGLLAALRGDAADALAHLQSAYDLARKEGYALEQAKAARELAQWERRQGDGRRAEELSREADSLFDRCGVRSEARAPWPGWDRPHPPAGRPADGPPKSI